MKSNIERISTAVFLIFLGTLFLLGNFNLISWSNLFLLFFKYWPILFVVGGLKIMVGILDWGKWINLVIDIIIDVLIILALLFPAPFMLNSQNGFGPQSKIVTAEYKTEVKPQDFPSDNIKERILDVQIGATKFDLTDYETEKYLEVSGKYPENFFTPSVVSEVSGDKLNVNFYQSEPSKLHFGFWNKYESDFSFVVGNTTLPTQLNLNLGAGQGDITLDQLNLTETEINVGAGQLNLELKSKPNLVNLGVGAGEVVLRLPKDSNVSLTYNVGVGNITINKEGKEIKTFGGLATKGDYEYTPSLESSYMLKLNANVGAGSLKIIFE